MSSYTLLSDELGAWAVEDDSEFIDRLWKQGVARLVLHRLEFVLLRTGKYNRFLKFGHFY